MGLEQEIEMVGGMAMVMVMVSFCVRNVFRTSSAEKRSLEQSAYEDVYNEMREAAEAHRQVWFSPSPSPSPSPSHRRHHRSAKICRSL